jgi:hypothetical protein
MKKSFHRISVRFRLAALHGLLLATVSCGTNDATDLPDVSTSDNHAPVANAGGDLGAVVHVPVALDGSASTDADGNALTFKWQIVAGPPGGNGTFDDSTSAKPNVSFDMQGSYRVSLTVNDGQLSSAADDLNVRVEAGSDSTDTSTGGTTTQSDGNTTTETGTTTTPSDDGEIEDIRDIVLVDRDPSCTNYVGQYIADVTDIKRSKGFRCDVAISNAGQTCTFVVNEIPNHDFNDASAAFASSVSAQNGRYEVPVAPSPALTPTELSLAISNALFLNGVTVDLLAAACYGVGSEPLGNEKIGCGPDQIANPWRYDPMSPLNQFGTDVHNAHPQPDGTYHYHGNPMALFDLDCEGGSLASPLIGFAADGFPVFGPCIVEGGVARKVTSSYQLKDGGGPRQAVSGYTTPQGGVGAVASNNYDGQFRGDWEYQEGSGDLDECNGMTFEGTYGYYLTDSYPWVMGCLKGTPDNSFSKMGRKLDNAMHGHPHTQKR